MHKSILVFSVLGFSLFLVTGCGGGAGDAPDLASVSGTVMLDGKPAGGLTVEFLPDNNAGTSGPMSVAVTADDGTFMLSTSTGRAGAVIGTHKVLVKCPWRLEGRAKATSTADGFGSSADGSEPPPAPEKKEGDCNVDIKFESVSSTPLSAEVPAGGVNDLLLQATSG